MPARAASLAFALLLTAGCTTVLVEPTPGTSSSSGSPPASTVSPAGGGAGGAPVIPPGCAGDAWSQAYGNADQDQYPLAATVVDGECNVLFAGMVIGPIDLGAGPEGAETLHLAVVKRDAAGKLLWSKQLPPGAYWAFGKGLAVDAGGDVLLGGLLEGIVDFGGGPVGAGYSGSSDDLFLARFDRDGHHLWSKGFHGSAGGPQYVNRDLTSIATLPSGDVVIAGNYGGTLDLGGGPLPAASGGEDLFLARFDAAGNLLSQKGYGSAITENGAALSARPDGSFVLAANCGPDSGLGAPGHGLCVASFTAAGEIGWARNFPKAGNRQIAGVGVDAAGRIVVGGFADAPLDFGAGEIGTLGELFGFAAALDAGGDHVWSHAFPGAPVRGVTAVPGGGAVVAGALQGTTDIAGVILESAGGYDAFVAVLDASGAFAGSAVFGGPGTESAESVAVDPAGHIYVGGGFDGSVDIGTGVLSASPGRQSAFAARLGP